jgi:hypothetical protein
VSVWSAASFRACVPKAGPRFLSPRRALTAGAPPHIPSSLSTVWGFAQARSATTPAGFFGRLQQFSDRMESFPPSV